MKNRVQLIGHVGQEPEVKMINDKKLAVLSLATNEYYTNEKGEKQTTTEWHRVSAWGKTAEIIEKFVTKGKEIAIEGKLTYNTYENKSGDKVTATNILVQDIMLIGK
jgi:single-strand DNA-binding protein